MKKKDEIVKEDLLNFPNYFPIPEYPSVVYSEEINISIEQFEEKLHYNFMEKFWLLKAFTNCTYVNENIHSNKQLTFIGQ